ncbi:glycosyltransferase family 4 protein [Desulfovibrio sp. UCD-KL4C]|uniref:glycosyltransferase family 4 protein n=1 Tax=Desulfovibrio sp. UCD-KL4C TaxID=2578120 RepID=UPI0025BF3F2B|nr:glycosyltransferase family 4 protein [Desulfovibrio sp. UCD-KL4C]
MNILFITQSGPDLPSVRFRVLPFVEHARKEGHNVDWKRIPKAFHKRLAFFLTIPRNTIVILQKKLLTGFQLALLKSRSSTLVFDFDDALWTSHPSVPIGPKRDRTDNRNAVLLKKTCLKADLIVAGNNYLSNYIKSFNQEIEIIPTPLDTDKYHPPETRDKEKTPIVGWMGTSCNLFFLPDVLKSLSAKVPPSRISIISDKPLPKNIAGLAEFEKWSGENEVKQLQNIDIGLMPLTDDDYTKGKCGFKLLQYMACGAVPLASNVGFNVEIIEHGVNGFLINNHDEWAKYVELLSNDSYLRHAMAKKARETVEEKFSLIPLAKKLWARLEKID